MSKFDEAIKEVREMGIKDELTYRKCQIEKLLIAYYESRFEQILNSNTRGHYGDAVLTKSISDIAKTLVKVVVK